jgi:hypothetical protein
MIQGRPTGYRLFLLRNEENMAVAAYAGSLMDMRDGRAVFIGTYAATRACHQRLGLMRELFISGLMQAAADAHELEEDLALVIGDCTKESEPTWNAVGRKRLCCHNGRGGFKEVALLQPAIRFDLHTGQPACGMEVVKEHLMVRSFGDDITKPTICAAVDGYYRWCGKRPLEDFDTLEAYNTYRAHFDGLLALFRADIEEGGELALFSAAERAELEAKGIVFE